jgi:hypothetical protein
VNPTLLKRLHVGERSCSYSIRGSEFAVIKKLWVILNIASDAAYSK